MRGNVIDKEIILETNKTIFTKKNILVKCKNECISIDYSNIKETSYYKKNLLNYIFIY